jgi:hypothetical protein
LGQRKVIGLRFGLLFREESSFASGASLSGSPNSHKQSIQIYLMFLLAHSLGLRQVPPGQLVIFVLSQSGHFSLGRFISSYFKQAIYAVSPKPNNLHFLRSFSISLSIIHYTTLVKALSSPPCKTLHLKVTSILL